MKITGNESYVTVLNSLAVMKRFMKRREYKSMEKMCRDLIPGEEMKEFSVPKLEYIPSGIDFADAVEKVWKFLLRVETERSKEQEEKLNRYGFHSKTVLECMNVLFRKHDYLCIEDLCRMIEDEDLDNKSKGIKKLLLETRNNLTTAKKAGECK